MVVFCTPKKLTGKNGFNTKIANNKLVPIIKLFYLRSL